jgi:exo-beta-1,3-glucanase (GH17 family)
VQLNTNSGSSAPIKGGSQWAMTYSPYTSSGSCKDAGSVASDIAMIASKGFSTVRLYSTDCGGLANVASAASQHGISLIIGIYIDKGGIQAAAPQVKDITEHFGGKYGMVEMVVVGNEAIFNHFATAGDLAAFISQVKSTLKAAGYNGPITTTEPMSTLAGVTSIICPVIDVVAANIHPFFNSDIAASQAGQFVAKSLQDLAGYCPGKPEVFNLETGWPSQGQANGQAVPGSSQQAQALKSIVQAAGAKSAVFSFVDDLWKGEGEFGVERSWGCSHLFG